MEPRIEQHGQIILAGVSFYGDPFAAHDPWREENEIGRLWTRFMALLQEHGEALTALAANPGETVELHLPGPDTAASGVYEVFIGLAVTAVDNLPLPFVAKVLPPHAYAVFPLRGAAIAADWHNLIYQDWLPGSGYEAAATYGFQIYDARFKGLDRLAESELDVYIPVRHAPHP